MGVTQGAGLSLKWLRDTACAGECSKAAAMGVDPYVVMDSEAADSPIGANRLLYLPYLMGERTPHLDPSARGVFFGLSAMHTRADLIRAVMEGVAFSLNDCREVIAGMGIQAGDMAACGGGGRGHPSHGGRRRVPFGRGGLPDHCGGGPDPGAGAGSHGPLSSVLPVLSGAVSGAEGEICGAGRFGLNSPIPVEPAVHGKTF